MFAEFLENREAVAALRPWWRKGFRITLEQSPRYWSDVNPYMVKIERLTMVDAVPGEPTPHLKLIWAVKGAGETLAAAAQLAAEQAAQEDRNVKP